MKMRSVILLSLCWLLATAGAAQAAEQLGVQEYPGAKSEAAAADVIKQMFPKARAFCYSTNDSVETVVAFYKKQGLSYLGGDKDGGMLKKNKVEVSVQTNWADMKTGNINRSTLISFVQHAE